MSLSVFMLWMQIETFTVIHHGLSQIMDFFISTGRKYLIALISNFIL
jgi:hypothetical protein